MAQPLYSAADYQSALLGLLPRGRVWPKDQDAVQAAVMAGLAPTFARLDAASQLLLIDAFPATTQQLLPEWEASLGLPDPCAGASPTTQQREAQVLARLTDTGGQSVPYFIALAAKLGFAVTITERRAFKAGRGRAGEPCNGDVWAHVWTVNSVLNTVTAFKAGQSAAGEPLRAWGNAVLECELRARSPAQSILQFAYIDLGPPGTLDFSDPANSGLLGAI